MIVISLSLIKYIGMIAGKYYLMNEIKIIIKFIKVTFVNVCRWLWGVDDLSQ